MSQRLILKNLTIQNFATFENQKINFHQHFNAIVGETGSGKSLVLDALQLIFGARADKKIVRRDTEFATVEAIFSAEGSNIYDYFDEIGFPIEDDEIVIKRTIYSNGKTKAFINFQSCSLQNLTHFARRFIDLVGQFENQKLLSEDYQLELIDSYAKNGDLFDLYQNHFQQYVDLNQQIKEIEEAQQLRAQREDYLRFQVKEIESLDPSLEDEQTLQKQKEEFLNTNQRKEVFSKALDTLSESDYASSLSLLNQTLSSLNRHAHLVGDQVLEQLETAKQLIEDCSYQLAKNMDCDLSDEDLENVIQRLDLYQKLKRRFGGSTEQLIEQYTSFKNELNNFNTMDQSLHDLLRLRQSVLTKCQELAHKLSQTRTHAASELSMKLTESVRLLKMNGATISIQIFQGEDLLRSGRDRVQFMAETNRGEGLFKVKDIASGGELSRILLSVRSILSSTDSISVFLFDEIDTGIGGETAVCTGQALKNVSQNSQVIAITHLPQIAYFADKLIGVSKHNADDRTYSQVEEIEDPKSKQQFIKAMNPIEV